MAGEVSYLEIGTKEPGSTQVFFEQLFGWTFHTMGGNGEGWFQTQSVKAGLHGNDPEPQFFIFFNVSDLELAIAQVKALGGEADEVSPEEPGFGQFCTCRDPQGVRFGLHQSSESHR